MNESILNMLKGKRVFVIRKTPEIGTADIFTTVGLEQLTENRQFKYSRTSMARTPSGPWKYVRDRGSTSL